MYSKCIRHLGTEVCTKSPAHALAIALALVSESGPKMICGALSEVQAQSLGWCRTFGADLRMLSSVL